MYCDLCNTLHAWNETTCIECGVALCVYSKRNTRAAYGRTRGNKNAETITVSERKTEYSQFQQLKLAV